jgi:hypothetical protein
MENEELRCFNCRFSGVVCQFIERVDAIVVDDKSTPEEKHAIISALRSGAKELVCPNFNYDPYYKGKENL